MMLFGSCVQQGGRTPIQPVAFRRIHGELSVEYQRDTDTEKPTGPAAPETKVEKTELSEQISLNTRGYVYHPNLLDLGLAMTFGLRQFDFKDNTGSSHNTGALTEYDISGDILKRKPYPMSFFWRRQNDTISRTFAPPIEQESQTVGGSLRLVSPLFPTALSFSRMTVTQRSPFSALGDSDSLDQTEDTFRWHTDAVFSPDHTLSWDAVASSLNSRQLTLRSEDEVNLNLQDIIAFGPESRHGLESTLGYLARTGDLALTQLDWRERMDIRHADNFRTNYYFNARSIDVNALDQTSNQFGVGLHHKLYESLITTADVHLTQIDFSTGSTRDEIAGNVSLNYRKTNPAGLLLADLTLDRSVRDEKGPVSRGSTIDEAHTLTGTSAERIDQRRVVITTVVVTDLARLVVYNEGMDYALRSVGSFVEIERLLGGGIVDGETVLVTYEFDVGGDLQTDTNRWALALRQDFQNGFSIYGRHVAMDQAITGDVTGAVPDNVVSDLVGAEYDWRQAHFLGEYEDRRATIQPVKSTRFRADYRTGLSRDTALRSGAEYTIDRFTMPPFRNRTTTTVFSGVDYHPKPALLAEAYAVYALNDDDSEGVTKGLSFRSALTWRIRLVDVKVRYEHNSLNRSLSTDRSDDSLVISVSRRF